MRVGKGSRVDYEMSQWRKRKRKDEEVDLRRYLWLLELAAENIRGARYFLMMRITFQYSLFGVSLLAPRIRQPLCSLAIEDAFALCLFKVIHGYSRLLENKDRWTGNCSFWLHQNCKCDPWASLLLCFFVCLYLCVAEPCVCVRERGQRIGRLPLGSGCPLFANGLPGHSTTLAKKCTTT
ncbi:hypothetical protein EDD21DRAFT_126090 [Dissophora ornata]|nr:hypothetical protein EDD21DRAFT_126090 [Dissophora ornata]